MAAHHPGSEAQRGKGLHDSLRGRRGVGGASQQRGAKKKRRAFGRRIPWAPHSSPPVLSLITITQHRLHFLRPTLTDRPNNSRARRDRARAIHSKHNGAPEPPIGGRQGGRRGRRRSSRQQGRQAGGRRRRQQRRPRQQQPPRCRRHLGDGRAGDAPAFDLRVVV